MQRSTVLVLEYCTSYLRAFRNFYRSYRYVAHTRGLNCGCRVLPSAAARPRRQENTELHNSQLVPKESHIYIYISRS